MKYLALLLTMLGLATGASLSAQDKDTLPSPAAGAQIVAHVNESFITFRDVVRRATIMGTDHTKALQTLIEDKVITNQAVKENIQISNEEVQKTVIERLDKFTTVADFTKNILTPLGMTFGDYTADMKEQLLREKYIQSKIGTHQLEGKNPSNVVIDTFVSPREIKEYFEKNKAKFDQPAKIKTRQIILNFSDNESRIDKKFLADKILEQLRAGEDFAALAKKHSSVKAESGGDWDWTKKGSFADDVENILFALKKGETSPVIQTDRSFIIARVEDKTDKQPAFDTPEIQEEIRRTLSNQKFITGAIALKNKLLKDASIYVNPKFIAKPQTTDRPENDRNSDSERR